MMSHHSLRHVSDSDLVAYAHQQLTDAQREVIDQHLDAPPPAGWPSHRACANPDTGAVFFPVYRD
jgi:hypothetical protein